MYLIYCIRSQEEQYIDIKFGEGVAVLFFFFFLVCI